MQLEIQSRPLGARSAPCFEASTSWWRTSGVGKLLEWCALRGGPQHVNGGHAWMFHINSSLRLPALGFLDIFLLSVGWPLVISLADFYSRDLVRRRLGVDRRGPVGLRWPRSVKELFRLTPLLPTPGLGGSMSCAAGSVFRLLPGFRFLACSAPRLPRTCAGARPERRRRAVRCGGPTPAARTLRTFSSAQT